MGQGGSLVGDLSAEIRRKAPNIDPHGRFEGSRLRVLVFRCQLVRGPTGSSGAILTTRCGHEPQPLAVTPTGWL